MTIKYKLCTLLIMLLTASAQATVNPPVSATPKAKAFYRDDQIWPTTNIPVCWENLATILSKPIWKQRRISTLAYVNAAWGDSNPSIHKTGEGTVSLLRFTDTNKKCPLPSAIPAFTGIRILASSNMASYIAIRGTPAATLYESIGKEAKKLAEWCRFGSR
jgi:hypothetical protein